MQFKHPELLWALLLLLIPIIIHLFQLRRFKKTPFTNVAMLQKVVAESRKSSSIKKWLLLITRLALFACLVIAFAQPFFAEENALKDKETVIYLDNSFSMQSKQDGLNLSEKAVQDILKIVPENFELTLFTNDRTYKKTALKTIQNSLLALEYSGKQLTFDEIVFKASNYFSKDNTTLKNLILISDFQNRLETFSTNVSQETNIHLVQLKPDEQSNIAIDSIYLGKILNNQKELHVAVTGLKKDENVPISLFNGDNLIAKTAVISSNQSKDEIIFSIPEKEKINGKIIINDNSLSYDNEFYFNIEEQEKIKVLSIDQADSGFLTRIFNPNEFEFSNYELNTLNYGLLESQNLIILNGLESIPTNLQTALNSYEQEGGSLIIIPSEKTNIASYNSLLNRLSRLQFQEKIELELPISQINFDHPLYQNVFEEKVTNFEYPTTNQYYKTNKNGSAIISFSNGEPYLINANNTYVFTAPIAIEHSNFQASPLIVPTFFNIGASSLKQRTLYLKMSGQNQIDIATTLEKDNIVHLKKGEIEFIPRQQSFANKVSLSFADNPKEAGIYAVVNNTDTLQHVSFNYARDESLLSYIDISEMDSVSLQNTIPELFNELSDDNTISNYWKWFVIFALVFALLELLIQKLLA